MRVIVASLCITLLLILPIGLAAAINRRRGAPWAVWLLGGAAFIVAQAVHLPALYLLRRVGVLGAAAGDAPSIGDALLLGTLAGLCEEPARAAVYLLRRRTRRVSDGLMLGLGHGGTEAMLLGGVFTAANLGAYLLLEGSDPGAPARLGISPDQAARLREQLAPVFGHPLAMIAVPLERALAMALHVALSLLVLDAVRRRSPGMFVLAVAYHAAVDTLGVLAARRLDDVWVIEAVVAAAVLPGALWAGARVRRSAAAERCAPALSLRAELAVFLALLRKELRELARTRRMLIVGATLVVLGLMSPVLASITPDLLRRFVGEQAAALVPRPTAADALAQLVKQISQLGLLVTVFMAVGTVAAEKERGTAAMALCKPVPRWAFVISKWCAQALVLAPSLLTGAAGALGYTWVLFGPVDLGGFGLMTLLLLVYLLVFSAVAVLASTVARSVGAAAGLAITGVVALLGAGAVPWIAGLTPGRLVAWAQALAGAAVPGSAAPRPEPGALAMSGVLLILLLVCATAAIEEQEI